MKMRKLFTLLLVAVMLLSLVGCAASSKAEVGNGAALGYDAAMPMEKPGEMYYESEEVGGLTVKDDSTTATAALPENRKLIQTIRMTAETEDLDALLGQLNTRIGELSGYVEGQNIYNGSAYSGRRYRNAELTVRIPADNAESFVNQVSELSNIVSSNKTVEDITLKYVSTESRMKALQTEEARLLELLAKAETMNDLLTIEKRLTEVRSELEMVTSSLRVYDNRVDYATIHLTISEVKEYTVVTEPETVWERIGEGFKETLEDLGEGFEDFFVYIVVNLPYFILWGAVIAVVVILLIRRKKKKAARAAEKKTE